MYIISYCENSIKADWPEVDAGFRLWGYSFKRRCNSFRIGNLRGIINAICWLVKFDNST